jgi:translation initiation factor IF-3
MIKVPEVRVIGSNGEQLGVMPTREAIRQAQEEGLDLVEVAVKENPPVCRIMDFGKFRYQEKKKKRESYKKQVKVEIKECKFRPKIGEHDFNVRIRRAVKFLSQGDKVKLTVMFRGREHAHPDIAQRLLERAFGQLQDLGRLEVVPQKDGRDMQALISPLPLHMRKKALKLREQKGETIKDTDDTEDIEDKKEPDKVEEVKEEVKEEEGIEVGEVKAVDEVEEKKRLKKKQKKQSEPGSGIPGVPADELPI